MSTRGTIRKPSHPESLARGAKSGESGYALLVVVFLAAAMIVATMAVTPKLLTQGRRDKEDELIWRGRQYARGVRLYFRKNGHFPPSLEDLTKASTGQVHFLRKPYVDPMNKKDGSWRLIYIGPNGELIGSVHGRTQFQIPGAKPPGGQTASSSGAQPPPPPQTQTPSALPPEEGNPGEETEGEQPAEPSTPEPEPSAQPPQPPPSSTTSSFSLGSEGKVFGGNIIGVASKINRRSLKVYEGANVYREWEFIWDPTKDAVVVGQPAFGAGAPGAGRPQTPQTPQTPTMPTGPP